MPASGSLRQKSTGLLVGYDQLHFVQEYHFLTHFNHTLIADSGQK